MLSGSGVAHKTLRYHRLVSSDFLRRMAVFGGMPVMILMTRGEEAFAYAPLEDEAVMWDCSMDYLVGILRERHCRARPKLD